MGQLKVVVADVVVGRNHVVVVESVVAAGVVVVYCLAVLICLLFSLAKDLLP